MIYLRFMFICPQNIPTKKTDLVPEVCQYLRVPLRCIEPMQIFGRGLSSWQQDGRRALFVTVLVYRYLWRRSNFSENTAFGTEWRG